MSKCNFFIIVLQVIMPILRILQWESEIEIILSIPCEGYWDDNGGDENLCLTISTGTEYSRVNPILCTQTTLHAQVPRKLELACTLGTSPLFLVLLWRKLRCTEVKWFAREICLKPYSITFKTLKRDLFILRPESLVNLRALYFP